MPYSINSPASVPFLDAQRMHHSTSKLPSTTSKASDLSSKAKEFEAILLGQWLQGSATAFGSVPGGDEEEDAGAEQMKGFAFQHLASGLAEKGGVGIAKIVEKALTGNEYGAPSSGQPLPDRSAPSL